MEKSSTQVTAGLGSPLAADKPTVQHWIAWHRAMLEALQRQAEQIRQGGGPKRMEREHQRGKLTARERIARLLDDPDAFWELGLWAGYGMYEEEGGCPAGGTAMGLGRVSGHLCLIVANDATVKAGAWFPITVKKNLR